MLRRCIDSSPLAIGSRRIIVGRRRGRMMLTMPVMRRVDARIGPIDSARSLRWIARTADVVGTSGIASRWIGLGRRLMVVLVQLGLKYLVRGWRCTIEAADAGHGVSPFLKSWLEERYRFHRDSARAIVVLGPLGRASGTPKRWHAIEKGGRICAYLAQAVQIGEVYPPQKRLHRKGGPISSSADAIRRRSFSLAMV
jgi:hypothetical protein